MIKLSAGVVLLGTIQFPVTSRLPLRISFFVVTTVVITVILSFTSML